MRHNEDNLQSVCFKWFYLKFAEYRGLLFHVPNGGLRTAATAATMKRIGVVSGVADLLFLVPRGTYHGLCIEMKSLNGKQTKRQREWQQKVEQQGYKYVVCNSYEKFRETIKDYLCQH